MRLRMMGFVLILGGFLASCKEKVVVPATETETNNWILAQMKYWYYWNDKIPASPDLTKTPDEFFNSLLYKYDATARPDGDRFSWIQESADELKASLSGESKTSGMHYKLNYYPTGTNDVIGVVLYTLPGSPAAIAGVKRGDIFTSVNNTKLNGNNYSQLLNASGALTYTMASVNADGVITESTVKKEITPVTFQEDPVFYDTLYTYGSNKVGYVVYHQFIPGPNGGNEKAYDEKLDAIFSKFKNNQINSLILDLRYNPGGYVSSATNLASLIGKVTANDIFYYKEYNSGVTADLEKKYGKDYFLEKFATKTQNVGSGLSNLVVLTSSKSASASELLINGLIPFMKVTLVGGKTVGKNVGSITISDDSKKVKWGIQPIVTKSFNGLRQSDYSVGFTPDFPATEGVKIYRYGDPHDPLLGEALLRIVGSPVVRTADLSQKRTMENVVEIQSTIDKKAGGGNMFFDK